MRIHLDAVSDGFLAHHRVGGVPLLPTVMALDLLARAALTGHPGASVSEIRDVEVGPPILFDGDMGRTIEVLISPGLAPEPPHSAMCRLVDADRASRTLHYAGLVVLADSPASAAGRHSRSCAQACLSLGSGDIYPPYFHGPTFQVIGKAARAGTSVTACLAEGLPELRWSAGPPVTAPALLELCLQACGLWELATTGRMMIPSGLDQVLINVPRTGRSVAAPSPIEARVWPTATSHGKTTFDGEVTDGDGRILLAMRGYRTADLGLLADFGHIDRIRRLLHLGAGAGDR